MHLNGSIAIIVAAGTGSRFGADLPKQFCNLLGRPLLMTTIDAFTAAMPIHDIRLVLSPEMIHFWNTLCKKHGFTSPQVIPGGATRHQSVKNALLSLQGLDAGTPVLIHDGARPFPSARLIAEAAAIPDGICANIPAVSVTDSLRELAPAPSAGAVGRQSRSVDRSRFAAVQTPQAARLGDLLTAYSLPYSPEMTDDASVLEAAGFSAIRLITGDHFNMKVTNPWDIAVATAIHQSIQQ